MIKEKDLTKEESLKETKDEQSNLIQVIEEREILNKNFKIYGNLDKPLFLAKDVADWIGHSQVSKMIKKIDDNEKVRNIIPTLGGVQEMWLLTEDGLYEVLMQSRKPIAKEFKKKVKEILKEIRLRGMYLSEAKLNEALEDKDKFAKELEELKKEKDNLLGSVATKEDLRLLAEEMKEELREEMYNEANLSWYQRFENLKSKIAKYTKTTNEYQNYKFLCNFLANFFKVDLAPYDEDKHGTLREFLFMEIGDIVLIEKAVRQLLNGYIRQSIHGNFLSSNVYGWKHEIEKLYNHNENKTLPVFEYKRYYCSYCCKLHTRDELVIEHITPKSKGGSNSLDNLTLSCRECNEIKGYNKSPMDMWRLCGQESNVALHKYVLNYW